MKYRLFIVLFALLFSGKQDVKSQVYNLTFEVLHMICDSDGVLVTHIPTNMTPPFTVEYEAENSTLYPNYIHSNVSGFADTLTNINHTILYVQVTDFNGVIASGFPSELYYGFRLFVVPVTPPVCPDTMATIQAFIWDNTRTPNGIASIEWYLGDSPATGLFYGNTNPIDISIYQHYSFIVTDSLGCTRIFPPDSIPTIGMQAPFTHQFQSTNANCTNGSASITDINNGTPPYGVVWSNGSNASSIQNIVQGNYGYTITDAMGCSFTSSFMINQLTNISVSFSVSNATCQGGNGSITANASGGTPPYTYLWFNGSTGQQITGLNGSQSYSLLVTDANYCYRHTGAYVGLSSPVQVTTNHCQITDCIIPSCQVSVSASGGTPPYQVVWNTFPPYTGDTLYGLNPGQYQYTVTDAGGCIRTGTAHVFNYGAIGIITNPTVQMITCQNPGYIAINAFSQAQPLQYNWSNGSNNDTLYTSQPGTYTCTVTNASGCSKVIEKTIGYSPSHLISVVTTPASCIYTSDGSFTATVTGGTPPFTFNMGAVSGNVSTVTGLMPDETYTITATDSLGCVFVKTVYIDYDSQNDSCYCTVYGSVYIDSNSNCIKDAGEDGIANVQIHCSSVGYIYTNDTGYYAFRVPSGTYTISESNHHYYPLAYCQSNAVPVTITAQTGCFENVSFAHGYVPVRDVRVFSHGIFAVPGFSYFRIINIKNIGTLTENDVMASHSGDGQLLYNSFSPSDFYRPSPFFAPNWHQNNPSVINLPPGNTSVFRVKYEVPFNIPVGTKVAFQDTVSFESPLSNWQNDYSPWNNIFIDSTIIVSSYDPNMKEVFPKGLGQEGFIDHSDSILTYTIHFQNLGTYFAQNVYILDTIDSDLELSTLIPLHSSHSCTISMTEAGIVKFSFPDIYLPYSSAYGNLSCGYVTYTIKQKPVLPPLTEIRNTAAIYFDYNEPVITNTTLNTIMLTTHKPVKRMPEISVFPNPTDNAINIQSPVPISGVIIFDCLGRPVYETTFSEKQKLVTLPVSHLAPGLYMAGCRTLDYRIDYVRFIKE